MGTSNILSNAFRSILVRWSNNLFILFGRSQSDFQRLVCLMGFFFFLFFFIPAGIVGLERFKWPCVAVCVCLYIIEIIQASCFAAFSVGLDFNKVILLLACTYVIVGNLLTILVGVVSVLLVKSLLSTGNTAMTIRFGITSFFLICLIQCNIVWLYLVLAGINGISPQWGEQTPQLCSQAALWWGAPIACIFLCMSFRLSVQKEIELSKSATSSTSSMSASSKSSSMSSASDPVIEL